MNKRHCFLWVMMLTGLVLVPVACSSAPLWSTSATPTIDSAHLTALAQERPNRPFLPLQPQLPLWRIPPMLDVCHRHAHLGQHSKMSTLHYLRPGIGGSPVWAIGFAGPHASAHLRGITEDATTAKRYGWEYKILWEIGPNYPHSVTLRGGSLRNRTLLWFQFGDQAPTMTPALDPQHPGTLTGSDVGWAGFPS